MRIRREAVRATTASVASIVAGASPASARAGVGMTRDAFLHATGPGSIYYFLYAREPGPAHYWRYGEGVGSALHWLQGFDPWSPILLAPGRRHLERPLLATGAWPGERRILRRRQRMPVALSLGHRARRH